jgi:hypothetical protein
MRTHHGLTWHDIGSSRDDKNIVKRQRFSNTAVWRESHAAGTLAELQRGGLTL